MQRQLQLSQAAQALSNALSQPEGVPGGGFAIGGLLARLAATLRISASTCTTCE